MEPRINGLVDLSDKNGPKYAGGMHHWLPHAPGAQIKDRVLSLYLNQFVLAP
jgi:hypothetical protein